MNQERLDRTQDAAPQSAGEVNSTILVAEDDEEMRGLLATILSASGYQVVECRDGIQLLAEVEAREPPDSSGPLDLIISDIRMPGISGLDVLASHHQQVGFPPMIVITAFGDEQTHRQARDYGAVATLDKPFGLEDLMSIVQRVLPAQGVAARAAGARD